MKKNQKTSGSFNGISSQAGIHDKEAVADQYDQIFNSIQKNIIKNEKPSIAQHMGFLLIQSDEQLLNKMHKIFGDEFSALIRKNEVENAALYMVQNDRSLKILKYLIDTLELNYLFEVRNKWDDNLLSIACEYRAKETALYLIEKGFYKSENGAINRVNETPLHGAARSGMLDVIKKLIEKYKAEESGIIFNKNTQAGDNFMHILNIFNHGDIYKELINKKAFLSNKQFTQLKNLQNKHGYACTQSELMLKKLKYSQREYSKPDIKIENLSQAISCFYKAMFSDRDERLLEEAVNKLHQEINDRRDLVLQARNKNISEADLLIIQFLIHNCIRVAIYDVNKNENILKYIEILCNLGNFHNIKFELFVSLAQTHSLIDNNIEKIIKYSKLAEAVYTEFPDIDYKMDIVTFFFNFGIFCLKYDFYQSLKERDVTYICNNELNMQKDGYNYIEKALNLIKKDKDL